MNSNDKLPEYLIIRPDGTQYFGDEGAARMASKREGFRVMTNAILHQPVEGEWVLVPRSIAEYLACHGPSLETLAAKELRNLLAAPTPPADKQDGDAVRALVAEWRERAEDISQDDSISLTHHLKLKDCADELEAVLEQERHR